MDTEEEFQDFINQVTTQETQDEHERNMSRCNNVEDIIRQRNEDNESFNRPNFEFKNNPEKFYFTSLFHDRWDNNRDTVIVDYRNRPINEIKTIKQVVQTPQPKEVIKIKDSEEIEKAYQCPICFENAINVFFGCGHGTCSSCSSSLEQCHMCRKNITQRIKIYL